MLHKLAVSFHQITLSTAFSCEQQAHTETRTRYFSISSFFFSSRSHLLHMDWHLELNEPLNGNYILPPVTPPIGSRVVIVVIVWPRSQLFFLFPSFYLVNITPPSLKHILKLQPHTHTHVVCVCVWVDKIMIKKLDKHKHDAPSNTHADKDATQKGTQTQAVTPAPLPIFNLIPTPLLLPHHPLHLPASLSISSLHFLPHSSPSLPLFTLLYLLLFQATILPFFTFFTSTLTSHIVLFFFELLSPHPITVSCLRFFCWTQFPLLSESQPLEEN